VREEFCLTGGPSLEQRDGRLNLLLRTDQADRSLVSLPDSRGEVRRLHRQESLGPKPLKEGGGHLPELPCQATDRDRNVGGEEAEQLLFLGSEVMGPLRQGLASLFGETHEAAGRGINSWGQGSLDHRSPGGAVVVGDPAGQFQQGLIEQRFRIEDVLNLFEACDLGALAEAHQVAGDDARSQGDEDALAGSGRLAEMGGDGIGQGLVNGCRQGDFGIGGTICWSHHLSAALLAEATLRACPRIVV
jgi:hypothetical protein